MTSLLRLSDASVARSGRVVLDGASLSVESGELVGVVGPNGAGKTTLLRAALGLERLAHGEAEIGGDDPRRLSAPELARRVGYLPQERRIAWNLPAWRAASLGAVAAPPIRAREIGLECLAQVGLSSLAERGVFEMSGGERARVLLARLFATGAPLLLADEPTAGLDPDAQFLTLDLLRRRAEAGAVVVTLHDLGLAARACDRLVVVHRGRILADAGPREALSPELLAEVFGLDGGLVDTPAGLVLSAMRLSERTA